MPSSLPVAPPNSRRHPRPHAAWTSSPATMATGRYEVHTTSLTVHASEAPQLVDLTGPVASLLPSTLVAGHVVVFCLHTTAALILNEDESLLHLDMADFLERLASFHASYRHDDLSIRTENLEEDHGRNGFAHLRQMVLGSSLCLPVVDGRLTLGRWQRLFLVELDRPRPRKVLVQSCGVHQTAP